MTLIAAIDGVDVADAASNNGWLQFSRWAAELDGVTELAHLVEHGWAGSLPDLADDLTAAITEGEPDEGCLEIATNLLSVIAAHGSSDGSVLVISDGFSGD